MKRTVSNAVFPGRDGVGAPRTVTDPRAAALGSQPEPGAAHFTQRQLEVLALLCEGLPNKLICRRLNIAAGTVKVHISCILRGLGVKSRLQAVVAARSLSLDAMISPGTPADDDAPAAGRQGRRADAGPGSEAAAARG